MANKVRPKMDRSNRAKQFMPFDALTGFREALREKERILVEQKELSEERKVALNDTLRRIRKMDVVTVTYFEAGEYLQLTGVVTKVDAYAGQLQVVNTLISFEDMIDIQRDME